jgi:hypothetical protein
MLSKQNKPSKNKLAFGYKQRQQQILKNWSHGEKIARAEMAIRKLADLLRLIGRDDQCSIVAQR